MTGCLVPSTSMLAPTGDSPSGIEGAISHRPCSGVPRRAAKHAPESKRGQHSQSTEPSRFIDEIPATLIEAVPSVYAAPQRLYPQYRDSYPRGGGYRGKVREEPVYAYENEDQSAWSGLRPGLRVRHAQFGVGTVMTVEPLDDDMKLVVRFNSVGQKTLRAKFARLELAANA